MPRACTQEFTDEQKEFLLKLPPVFTCKMCGNELHNLRLNQSSVKAGRNKFCSNACSQEYKVGSRNPCWKGKEHTFISTVRGKDSNLKSISRVYARSNGEWRFRSRIIVEGVLGRKLKKGEFVHHINCNSLDDRKCNLLVCDARYHTWLHQKMSELYAKEHFGGDSNAQSL